MARLTQSETVNSGSNMVYSHLEGTATATATATTATTPTTPTTHHTPTTNHHHLQGKLLFLRNFGR
jgi:hypothetical protein